MRALITGIEGFCGRYLTEWLGRQGVQVYGIELAPGGRQVCWPELESMADIRHGDMRDGRFVFDCVHQFRPDRIYHLAGITVEPDSWEATQALYATNINGTLNLLEAAKTERLSGVIVLISSSSAVYSPLTPDRLPLNEMAPLLPRNHYGLTKLAQEALGQVYFRKHGLRVLTVRSFNIIGPGQSTAFVTSSLAKQIAEVELGLPPQHIVVGNLEPQRDYVDVRDVVRAFWLATEKGRPGEVYNICSGQGCTVRQVLDGLLRDAKLEASAMNIKQPVERLRTTEEIMFHYGDYSKLKEATGWSPAIPLEKSLADLMEYWRLALSDKKP